MPVFAVYFPVRGAEHLIARLQPLGTARPDLNRSPLGWEEGGCGAQQLSCPACSQYMWAFRPRVHAHQCQPNRTSWHGAAGRSERGWSLFNCLGYDKKLYMWS